MNRMKCGVAVTALIATRFIFFTRRRALGCLMLLLALGGCAYIYQLHSMFQDVDTRLTLYPASMRLEVHRQLNPLLPPMETYRVKELQNLKVKDELKLYTLDGRIFNAAIKTPDDEKEFKASHYVKRVFKGKPKLIIFNDFKNLRQAKFLSQDLNLGMANGDEQAARLELRKLGIACE